MLYLFYNTLQNNANKILAKNGSTDKKHEKQ